MSAVVAAEREESESLIDGHRFASEQDATTNYLAVDTFPKSAVDLLPPQSRAVYIQYVKDSDDNLLVDGYFRTNMLNRQLPPGVNRIIAAYYLKTYSARNLHEKITALRMVIYCYFVLPFIFMH